MPRKKPLPDGRGLGERIGAVLRERYPAAWRTFPDGKEPILSGQAIAVLAERHKLPTGVDFRMRLNDALRRYFYADAQRRTELQYAQTKTYLQEVIDRATELRECLGKMAPDTEHAIYEQWDDIYPRKDDGPQSKYRWRSRIERDTHRLTTAARRALNRMPPYSSADRAFHALMNRLVELYESVTHRPVTGITKHSYADPPYSQPVVMFVVDCLSVAGIDKTNNAIGQAIALALKRTT